VPSAPDGLFRIGADHAAYTAEAVVKSIQQGLLAVAACGFLLIIAGAAVVFGIHRTDELADHQEYIGDKLFGVRQVFETLLSMESSQRGFLLTGNAAYLEPYQQDSARLDGTIANFENLYRSDPAASDMVAEIRLLARTNKPSSRKPSI
jgi:two-component system, chemotaxis family, sensor kinase CheA